MNVKLNVMCYSELLLFFSLANKTLGSQQKLLIKSGTVWYIPFIEVPLHFIHDDVWNTSASPFLNIGPLAWYVLVLFDSYSCTYFLLISALGLQNM